MKTNDLKDLIESAIYDEVKTSIINESKKNDVYHISNNGKPLATFKSEKDAKVALPKLKKKHPGVKLIIEKATYESYGDMIEYFDKISEDLENENMKNNQKLNEGLSDEGKNKIKDACEKRGCRAVAKKLVDNFLARETGGLTSSDLADTSTFADGLDEIQDLLKNEEYDAAFNLAKDVANDMLADEGFDIDMDESLNEQFEDEYFGDDYEDDDDDDDMSASELAALIGSKHSHKFEPEDDEDDIARDFKSDKGLDVFDNSDEDEVDAGDELDLDDTSVSDDKLLDNETDETFNLNEATADTQQFLTILPALAPMLGLHLYQMVKRKLTDSNSEEEYTGDVGYETDDDTQTDSSSEIETDMTEETVKGMCSECGSMLTEEGSLCSECMALKENKGVCSECGKTLEEGSMCSECKNLKENKKTKIKLTETQLRNVVEKMMMEAMKGQPGTPGVVGKTIANRMHKGSGDINKEHYKDVEKKMKDYLSFDGNTNPEFPNQIGGERMAIHPSKEQADEIRKNSAGMANLDYDIEPSENFKKRLDAALTGDSKMGNSSVTGDNNVKTSNGAKAKDAKEKSGNTIPTKTDGVIKKQVADRKKDKDERELYNRAAVPTKRLDESVDKELDKMKRLSNYNKRTQ